MKTIRNCAVAAVILTLQACAMPVKEADSWPAQLPAREYFERIYASDAKNAGVQTRDQYLAWVRRFYEGSEFYAWGFLDLQSLVLDGRVDASVPELRRKLEQVGMQIGGEWAKDGGARVINTRMLAVWAEAIQAALTADPLQSVVNQVGLDVAAVLSGELQAAAITPDRYGSALALAYHDDCIESAAILEDNGC